MWNTPLHAPSASGRRGIARTAVTVVALVALPFVLSMDVSPPMSLPWAEWSSTVNLILVAIVGAAAFNLLLGYTHQISVAHAAFLMLGTITAAWLGTTLGWSFFLVLPVAGVLGALAGVVVGLPALRFRGIYLLIATLGIHFVAALAYSGYIGASFPSGVIRFESPSIPAPVGQWLPGGTAEGFLIRGDFRWYWVLLVVTTASLWFMANVVRTRTGRSFVAVKEHDVAASLIGIDVTRAKLQAFAVSSAFVAMSGALGSYYLTARGEDSFPFAVVLNFAIMIIVGGFSSLQGAVLGAIFFYTVPVLVRWSFAELPGLSSVSALQQYSAEINLGMFGIVIILVLVLRPEGLVGILGRLGRRRDGSSDPSPATTSQGVAS